MVIAEGCFFFLPKKWTGTAWILLLRRGSVIDEIEGVADRFTVWGTLVKFAALPTRGVGHLASAEGRADIVLPQSPLGEHWPSSPQQRGFGASLLGPGSG